MKLLYNDKAKILINNKWYSIQLCDSDMPVKIYIEGEWYNIPFLKDILKTKETTIQEYNSSVYIYMNNEFNEIALVRYITKVLGFEINNSTKGSFIYNNKFIATLDNKFELNNPNSMSANFNNFVLSKYYHYAHIFEILFNKGNNNNEDNIFKEIDKNTITRKTERNLSVLLSDTTLSKYYHYAHLFEFYLNKNNSTIDFSVRKEKDKSTITRKTENECSVLFNNFSLTYYYHYAHMFNIITNISNDNLCDNVLKENDKSTVTRKTEIKNYVSYNNFILTPFYKYMRNNTYIYNDKLHSVDNTTTIDGNSMRIENRAENVYCLNFTKDNIKWFESNLDLEHYSNDSFTKISRLYENYFMKKVNYLNKYNFNHNNKLNNHNSELLGFEYNSNTISNIFAFNSLLKSYFNFVSYDDENNYNISDIKVQENKMKIYNEISNNIVNNMVSSYIRKIALDNELLYSNKSIYDVSNYIGSNNTLMRNELSVIYSKLYNKENKFDKYNYTNNSIEFGDNTIYNTIMINSKSINNMNEFNIINLEYKTETKVITNTIDSYTTYSKKCIIDIENSNIDSGITYNNGYSIIKTPIKELYITKDSENIYSNEYGIDSYYITLNPIILSNIQLNK